MNRAKSESTASKIDADRDLWHLTLRWITRTIKARLAKGRKVLVENPWPSELWNTLCFYKLLQEELHDAETGQPLELVRGDQCQFGLVDHTNGMPHMKATGFLTATDQVNNNLSKRCNWEHVRSPLEGSNKTKRAQVWPRRLCEVILKGFISELEERSLFSAFAGEFSTEIEEEETPLGQLDAIYDEKDVSKSTIVTAKTTEEEIQRLESIEEDTTLGDSTSLEATRRQKWLKADRAIRVALRRLRSMTGHCSTSAMVQLLRTAGAPQPTLEAARHFACETCRKTQKVEPPNRVKAPNKPTFNWEISCDAFEVKDSKGNRHIVLSVVCLGTLFHQAFWVGPGGVPKSLTCAQALRDGWFNWAGPPRQCLVDRGVHNRGQFAQLLTSHGVDLRFGGLEAPFQLGPNRTAR